MGSTVADGVQRRRGEWLHALWQKYGLIVVGNLVFFALLYFVQYRPNSRDNRATELLTLAQREEAEGRLEAAETLYGKILSDYDSSSAFALAKDRSDAVRAAIVAAIDSASAEVSLAAIAALAQHAPEHASAPIRRVVEDRSGYFAPEVRAAAERALQRLAS